MSMHSQVQDMKGFHCEHAHCTRIPWRIYHASDCTYSTISKRNCQTWTTFWKLFDLSTVLRTPKSNSIFNSYIVHFPLAAPLVLSILFGKNWVWKRLSSKNSTLISRHCIGEWFQTFLLNNLNVQKRLPHQPFQWWVPNISTLGQRYSCSPNAPLKSQYKN